MAETYCGKTCEACCSKDELNCPGCRVGPGNAISGDCDIAQCTRMKGHEACSTCNLKGNCGKLRGSERMPAYRQRKLRQEAERQQELSRRVPLLAKGLWVLFWLFIPTELAGLMTNENVARWFPSLYIPGVILAALSALAYGAILCCMRSADDRYRKAGVCYIIVAVLSTAASLISRNSTILSGAFFLTLPAMIVNIVAQYHEITAYSDSLHEMDSSLAEKWFSLWKWYIIFLGLAIGSILIVFIIPLLAMLTTLAASLGSTVVGILKLVYLYRSAKLLRGYATEISV